MGKSFKKLTRALIAYSTFGLSEVGSKKNAKVDASGAIMELQKEKAENARKRQALFETEGGVLGEEVESIGKKKRGTILGN